MYSFITRQTHSSSRPLDFKFSLLFHFFKIIIEWVFCKGITIISGTTCVIQNGRLDYICSALANFFTFILFIYVSLLAMKIRQIIKWSSNSEKITLKLKKWQLIEIVRIGKVEIKLVMINYTKSSYKIL